MKQIYSFIVAMLFVSLQGHAQLAFSWWGNETNGGDKLFEVYLACVQSSLDYNGDGKLSSDERQGLYTLDLTNLEVVRDYSYTGSTYLKYGDEASPTYVDVTTYCSSNKITLANGRKLKKLRGLYQFPELRTLIVNSDQLESVELKTSAQQAKLYVLELDGCNNLQSLSMPTLHGDHGGSYNINISNCSSLESISIDNTQGLRSSNFKVSNCPALKSLHILQGALGSLDVSNFTSLEHLTFKTWNNCPTFSCKNLSLKTLNLEIYDLVDLNCSGNQLEELVLNTPCLRILNCRKNKLTELNVPLDYGDTSPLTKLYCQDNQLSSLDVSKCANLKELYCTSNQLTALDVTNNPLLENLQCAHNKIPALDLSQNPELVKLYCEDNLIPTLDLTNNTKLTHCFVQENQLPVLDLSKCTVIEQVDCRTNQIESILLPENPTTLLYLYCQQNKLTNLDAIADCTNLERLTCEENQIVELPLTSTAIWELHCEDNQLNVLDVSAQVNLTELKCDRNHLTTLDLSAQEKLEILTCSGQTKEVLVTVCGTDRDAIGVQLVPNGWDVDNVSALKVDNVGRTATLASQDGADYLVVSNGATAGDMDLYHKYVTYNYAPQIDSNAASEIQDVQMDVTITTSPYTMYLHPATLNADRQSTNAYCGTLYLDYPAFVPEEAEAKCYIATSVNDATMDAAAQLVLTEITGTVPANTAIVVTTTNAKYLAFYEDKSSEAAAMTPPSGNILAGSVADITGLEPYTVLTLGHDKSTNKMGFWNFSGTTVKAHRAYIPASVLGSLSPVGNGVTFLFPDEITGISGLIDEGEMKKDYDDNSIYSLDGRKVLNNSEFIGHSSQLPKGIYVKNGKKFVVK